MGWNELSLGSWGDFLNRSNAPPVDVKVSQAETRKPKKQSSTIGTQTEAAHPTHDETSNSAGNKDIVETITQLHQLCAKLKDEVTQVTLAKERMETDLLSLIHEKDLIISSYHKVRSPAPRIDAPPQIPQPVAASNSDLNRFRVVLRYGLQCFSTAGIPYEQPINFCPFLFSSGVRSIISQELEEMKRRPGFPLPPQDLHLDKILHRLYPNNDEEVGGGDRNGNGSRRHVVSACSTPGSSIIEDFGDMEGSSTQYLNLPRQ